MKVLVGGRPEQTNSRPCYMLGFGCPKSGTSFMASFLGQLGNPDMRLGHESMDNQGAVGYNMCNSNWPTDPTNKTGPDRKWRSGYDETKFVFHLVRDPRKTIPSMKLNFKNNAVLTIWMNENGGTWEQAWVRWNLKCEEEIQKAKTAGCHVDFVRIEDVFEFGERVRKFFGFERSCEDAARGVHKRATVKDFDYLNWSDLSMETIEMAERYGYDTGGIECLHTSEAAASV
jgi:hypothetical protein